MERKYFQMFEVDMIHSNYRLNDSISKFVKNNQLNFSKFIENVRIKDNESQKRANQIVNKLEEVQQRDGGT